MLVVKENKIEEPTITDNQIQINEFNIEDRVTLKSDNSIYIGSNRKELENDFYDVKIAETESGLAIYLNKLWYENYGEDYIQDEYLARICRELSSKLNTQNTAEQFEYVLYKYIKDNYVKVRQNENIEKILTEEYTLSLLLEDSIVKLMIQRSN